MTAKMILNVLFKVSSRTLKRITTVRTKFSNPISWPCAFCRAAMIAFSGTINSLIAFESVKTNATRHTKFIFRSGVFFQSHSVNLQLCIEIDKDYFDAAVKRLQNHVAQTVLF